MEALFNLLLKIIRSPKAVLVVSLFYIVGYYIISALVISAAQGNDASGIWRKNGPADIVTSIVWVLMALMLISSLLELAYKNRLGLGYLVIYYFLFIFLFAFCYGILEWHWPGMLENVNSDSWVAEWQYILVSIQTQTTLGYTQVKPGRVLTELISSLQALLGLFFTIVFIAKAVNKAG
jgi:hypothetical protein